MTLKKLQDDVDQWIRATPSGYFQPLTNLGILTEETGELARILVRKYGEQRSKPGETDEHLADEMADILWVLTALANQCGVNLEDAVAKNFEKKNKRDLRP
ncbi:MAG: nucleotide pyrophosphohydrolase [Chitinophagaceae bacterium]|nr:nucleotide pyrophosphohydrolase [Chitinophagaceae bacterium]